MVMDRRSGGWHTVSVRMSPSIEGQRGELSLPVDRLPDPVMPLQVLAVQDATFDLAVAGTRHDRSPHRHDYHELIWTRAGVAHHLLDGALLPIGPSTITVIGRGQVHLWREAADLSGVIVRFRDELLADLASTHHHLRGAAVLSARPQVVGVPEQDAAALEGLLTDLGQEGAKGRDMAALSIASHLLAVLLLRLERWTSVGGIKVLGAGDEARIQRRFADALERDFARHHNVGHYAETVALPQARLSAALVQTTGRTTKEQIIDRVMLEAARLLRFTDLSVGQIAFRVGFEDQTYFSHLFKRRHSVSPSAFRHQATADPPPGRRHADRRQV
jgi:AraC family transcriptional activator of pobA